MAKRTAATELTDRNWDQEEEPEEAGVFKQASDDTLKTRHIIQAKRRVRGDATKSTAFSGFGGFSFKPMQASTPLVNTVKTSLTESKPDKVELPTVAEADKPPQEESTESDSRNKYLAHLKALNQSVTQWIVKHVEKNPYILLTPIIRDYEKYLAELQKERDATVTNGNSNGESAAETPKPAVATEEAKPPTKSGLTFGMGNLKTENTATSKPAFTGFGFGTSAMSTSTAGTSGFSFAVGSSKPEASKTEDGGGAGGGDEDEHVPPVVESIEHKEDGSMYSKKCKLFYQKDGAWAERGVGHLHLKNPEGKAQLLVRADTSLGNILLNIRLSESIPLARQGKNSITMMCVVHPEIPKVPSDKPIPMLIRVKTAEDADNLLAKMKEMQN